MKKTNTFTNIAMLVLFAAMAVYLGVYLFRSTQQSYSTAPAVLVTVSEGGQASGIVVREEQIIASDKEFLSLSVDDGKQVARDGEIAIGVDSKAALDSASRARELKKEIAYVSSLLSRAAAPRARPNSTAASTAPFCSSTPPSPRAARPSLTTSAWTSARCSSAPRRHRLAERSRRAQCRAAPAGKGRRRPRQHHRPGGGAVHLHGGRL